MDSPGFGEESAVNISVVIPMLNEADTLPQLLAALAEQALKPAELIFVDSGSDDGGPAMIERWAAENNLAESRCQVIANLGGLPGGNRNRGVMAATSKWIAFLDCGIVPDPDWLANLWRYAGETGAKAVFGCCRFDAERAFEKALCALSNGCGVIHSVLPASLFHRSVFDCAGRFREDLRSAEDQLWMREVERCFGPRTVCEEALVHYRNFPTNISAVAHKWWLYEQNTVRARLHAGQQWALMGLFGVLIIGLLVLPSAGVMLFLTYLLLRGVIDPMRRSRRVNWWGDQSLALFIAVPLALVLDSTKMVSAQTARLRRLREGSMSTGNREDRVVQGFGEEWLRFPQDVLSQSERRDIFEDYFAIFPWAELPPRALGADIGCGSGRWAVEVAPRVGRLVCIDASVDALTVARRNLAEFKNIEFRQADVGTLPFADGELDFAYSLGVLHHVPDTLGAIINVARALKPGGLFLIYLYYAFDNQPWWVRFLWNVTDALRWIISKLPRTPRFFICEVIAALVYWPMASVAMVLDKLGLLPGNFPLQYYRDKSFYVMRTDALDRFGTRLEKRFTKMQIKEMLEAAGFCQICFSDARPYWCALGIKGGTSN